MISFSVYSCSHLSMCEFTYNQYPISYNALQHYRVASEFSRFLYQFLGLVKTSYLGLRICFQVFDHNSFYNKLSFSIYRNILSTKITLKNTFESLLQSMDGHWIQELIAQNSRANCTAQKWSFPLRISLVNVTKSPVVDCMWYYP